MSLQETNSLVRRGYEATSSLCKTTRLLRISFAPSGQIPAMTFLIACFVMMVYVKKNSDQLSAIAISKNLKNIYFNDASNCFALSRCICTVGKVFSAK